MPVPELNTHSTSVFRRTAHLQLWVIPPPNAEVGGERHVRQSLLIVLAILCNRNCTSLIHCDFVPLISYVPIVHWVEPTSCRKINHLTFWVVTSSSGHGSTTLLPLNKLAYKMGCSHLPQTKEVVEVTPYWRHSWIIILNYYTLALVAVCLDNSRGMGSTSDTMQPSIPNFIQLPHGHLAHC